MAEHTCAIEPGCYRCIEIAEERKKSLMFANYEHYHRPDLTDERVIKKEAEYRFDHGGWTSILHQHGHLVDCKGECKIYSAHKHKPDCEPDCDMTGEWTLLPAEDSDV